MRDVLVLEDCSCSPASHPHPRKDFLLAHFYLHHYNVSATMTVALATT